HRQGGRAGLPHADRRDPGRWPQAAPREETRRFARPAVGAGRRRGADGAELVSTGGEDTPPEEKTTEPTSPAPSPAPPPTAPAAPAARVPARKRLRDLGIAIGRFAPGRLNAITDVRGVRVGHVTLISGEGPLVPGKGPVRTGVTAVVPTENM